MLLSDHRTKIVATIGPASDSPETLLAMVRAGLDVARLNFSHGTLEDHRRRITGVREAASAAGRTVAVLADLPGPKIRLGTVAGEPVELLPGEEVVLSEVERAGRIPVGFPGLATVLMPGNRVFVNDGFIELKVEALSGSDVRCRIVVGGLLRSRQGVNLSGVDLGTSAFTDRDRECLGFAVGAGVDAVSQSFVSRPAEVEAVRAAAAKAGGAPLVIAKIERAAALARAGAILDAADGIMVARGDLGVEIPIEGIAIAQKLLIHEAAGRGKPVITATHMLESMTANKRPTRAEATDVANAILDGTDCVMLSGESAVGRYPVESVAMLAAIAAATEPHRAEYGAPVPISSPGETTDARDVIALSVARALEAVSAAAVFVPTLSGATARSVARCRPGVWIVAVSPREETCRQLQLTRGVHPLHIEERPRDWKRFARDWLAGRGVERGTVLLTEGPSPQNPDRNHRMELFEI